MRALVGIAVESVKFAVQELLKEHGFNVNSLQQCKVHIVDIFFHVPITSLSLFSNSFRCQLEPYSEDRAYENCMRLNWPFPERVRVAAT